MRHLIGIVLGVVAAAAIFFGVGWGTITLTEVTQSFGTAGHFNARAYEAFAALIGTGLLLGILVAVRPISPLAAGLPGLALLAWSVLFLVDTSRADRLVPMANSRYGQGFSDLLVTGVTALAGAIMIIPLFIPSRWRSRPRDDDYGDITTTLGLMR